MNIIFVKNIYKLELFKITHKTPDAMIEKMQKKIEKITISLRAFAYSLTNNEADAYDLYQDTALRILANAEKFKEGTNFKAWAVTIMRNIFINNYRKKMRRGVIFDQSDNDYLINSGSTVVENDGASNMEYKNLLKMVSKLPEEFKRPFWMAYKGYKYDEIAEELNAPLGTIKSRIFFARRKLMKMYNEANLLRA